MPPKCIIIINTGSTFALAFYLITNELVQGQILWIRLLAMESIKVVDVLVQDLEEDIGSRLGIK